ncbi:MAG: hypothetical protein H3C26_02570 [Rhodocyclaceae bacterium]|nr:hypothetical protein [Rhodocyclaceae bacterium]
MNDTQKKHGIARRAVVGLGRAWLYSIGITSLGRTLGRIGGDINAGFGHVRRKLADGNYRRESFQQAVERLDLDSEHLVHQARAFNVRAFSWLGAALLSLLWLLGAGWSDAPFSHAILCLGAVFMASCKSLSWRFRACQIRDGELYSFGPWFWSLGRRW